MHCEQGNTATGQDQAKFTDEVRLKFKGISSEMTSCTFPLPASRVWAVHSGDNDVMGPVQAWPEDLSDIADEESSQILDFEKLEHEILKNVLGEETCEVEQADQSDEVFPSFNYLPVPNPPSLPKSSLMLKHHPKGHIRQEKHQHKASQRQRSNTTLEIIGFSHHKSPDRRKSNFKTHAKNMEVQISRDKISFGELNYSKQYERKSRKYRSSKNISYREAAIRPLKSPATVTIVKRQPNCSPMVTNDNESEEQKSLFMSNLFACAKNEAAAISNKANKSKTTNNVWKTEQNPTSTLARAVLFPNPSPTRANEKQQQNTSNGRSGSSRRNLTLRQTSRSDQKKRKMGEKAVKTFAQIVATGTANAKNHYRIQK